jgi:two-component system sensor histidine kinase BaeS
MKKKYTLGIRYRLFLAFLAATCCVIVSMFVITRMSFEHGAFRYVREVEKEHLEQLARSLEQLYGEKGSWRFLEDAPTTWRELVAGSRPLRPLHPGHPPHDRGERDEHDPASFPQLPPPPLPKGEQLFDVRVLLLDTDRTVLYGPQPPWPQTPYLIALTMGERKIGQLGLIPLRHLVDVRVRQFVREQHQSLLVIALGIAAAAALLSIPLAGRMVRRITALATATTRLASGQYDIRVPADSGDELGQLARDFNRLAETLERNEQLRRRWVADISHELRTPLSVLRGEVEAVQDGVRPLTPQTMEVLHAEILHLSRLVDDLYELSLADIGALTYHKQEFDLGGLVAQAVHSCQEQFEARQLTVELSAPATPVVMIGDPERLRQLLNNLLCNSLRYTDPGGRLRIELSGNEEQIRLRCADSAPGVPEEALTRLFERLFRVEDSRNRRHGGAGLGLALCRSIVEAHGGTIRAAHSDLGGLEITITLPNNG